MATQVNGKIFVSRKTEIVAIIVAIITAIGQYYTYTRLNTAETQRQEIHILVNDRLTKSMIRNAIALERIAEITKNPSDIAVAKEARTEVESLHSTVAEEAKEKEK